MSSLIEHAGFDKWPGRLVRRWRRHQRETCLQIIAYHSVSSRPSIFTDGSPLRIHPALFERHADYLVENYRPLSLRAAVEMLERGETPERAVVLTFDGGCADNLACAQPILYRRRIPLTIFPAGAAIGNADLLWQHKLAWLTANGHKDRAREALTAAGIEPPSPSETIAAWLRRCYRWDIPDILESVLRSIGRSGSNLAETLRPYLDADEMAGVDPDFVEFGSHTWSHPVLARLSGQQQRHEIDHGRQIITAITGRQPLGFAYPFGLAADYDAMAQLAARQAGHRAVLDLTHRSNAPGTSANELSRKLALPGPPAAFEQLVEDWPGPAVAPIPKDGRAGRSKKSSALLPKPGAGASNSDRSRSAELREQDHQAPTGRA